MSRRYQYRWKIECAYHTRTDKKASHKGEWLPSKRACYKDFLKGRDLMEEHDQAYLYKRVVLPKHFLVFGKTQYNQYKYKIKAAFYRQEPMWTMYESKWGNRLGKTLMELKKFRRAGYSYVDCCDPIEYLYMRKPFPLENLPPFEPAVQKEEEKNFPEIDEKAAQKMERVMEEKNEDMDTK